MIPCVRSWMSERMLDALVMNQMLCDVVVVVESQVTAGMMSRGRQTEQHRSADLFIRTSPKGDSDSARPDCPTCPPWRPLPWLIGPSVGLHDGRSVDWPPRNPFP
jgi:hypothetical protein